MKPDAKYPEEFATCIWCELTCPEEVIQIIPIKPASISECYSRSHYPKFSVKQ